MATTTGVYPVWENAFKIGTAGTSSAEEDMKVISNMETFSIAIDGNVEEWNPLEQQGWTSRLVTGKSITFSINGKRDIGDDGNDYIAECFNKTGSSCNSKFEWTFPDSSKLEMECVISVTELGGGDTRNVAPLAVDIMSNGKPTFTPAS